MSLIEKLAIRGIRSFGPEDQQAIEFYTPLTLIVGHNGAGKTTVIECLKYATIGDMPPNSQKSFVHDPKVANTSEVKAQVKLQFKNVNGKEMVATRSLCMSQKKSTTTQKTLESLLSTKTDGGKTVSITSKCAELDAAIPEQLGVSKAILDNVIFCHQEESYWPLAEPSILKKKFDEIFASTRYTKALDSIKSLRKDSAVQIKLDQKELEHLKENKERADTLRNDREEIDGRIALAKARKQELEGGEISEIQAKLRNLEREQQKVQNVYSEIQQREMKKNLMQSSIDEMKQVIELYEDSDEQLQSMLDQYQDSIEIQQVELAELKETATKYNNSISVIEGEISKLLTAKGQLQAEVDSNVRRVAHGEQIITAIAKQTNIRGFSAPFDDEEIARFIDKLNEIYQGQQQQLDTFKLESQAHETGIMTRLQKAQSHITGQQEAKKMIKKQMETNRTKIATTTARIQSIAVTQSDISQLQSRVSEEQDWITHFNQTFHPQEVETKIKQLNQEVGAHEHTLTQLSDEMATLNLESSERARLGLKISEKKRKEEAVSTLMTSFKVDFRKLVGRDMNLATCSNEIATELRKKEGLLNNTKSKMEEKTRELSGVEAKLSMSRTRLQNLTRDVETKSKTINEACGGSDFLHAYEEAEQDYDDELSVDKTVGAATVMINKYLRMYNRDKCCPLCVRGFTSDAEAQNFLNRLNDSLNKMPSKEAQASQLAEKSARLKSLTTLKQTYHEMCRLRDTDLPALKKEIKVYDQEKEALVSELEDLEGDYAVFQVDVTTVSDVKTRCDELLRGVEEGKALENEVLMIERNLGASGGAGGRRVMNEVQREMEDISSKCKLARSQIDRLNNELRTRQRDLQHHEKTLQDVKTELQSKTFIWQERERLQTTISELKAEMDKFLGDVEVADGVILELTPSVRAIEQELSAEREKASKAESALIKTIQDTKSHISGVTNHQNELKRFKDTNTPGRLEKCNADMTKLRTEIEALQHQKEEAANRIATIQKSSSEVVVVQRAIADNLKYREQVRFVEEIQKEIALLQKEANRFDVTSVQSQRKKLTVQYEQLCEELAGLSGELKQMEEQVNRIGRDVERDFADVAEKHTRQVIKLKTESLAIQDLEKYSKALENAIMKYHTMKMDEINKIIRELWCNTYKGNDIETIEIRSDNEGSTAKNRSYNYRVVMIKEQTELDMRGRCSAGQKVLACLIIRLALAETFCLNCGILALDEPTTNLDRDNSDALAESLSNIISLRRAQKNFQLIIITHDEDFMAMIGHHDYADYYFRVSKDAQQHSVIEKQRIV
ncbi:UNVERIFIED_CONTAM: DNA repair protein rad50 [Siphonaria sp. JEL0065]|nr:DNA repair protein rad50 [Siphonaria sp. JEL0065]